MKTKCKYTLLFLLVFSMAFGSTNPVKVQAAKVKLSQKSMTMYTYETRQLKMKNVKTKVTWRSSNNRLIKITEKKGKYDQKVVIRAFGKTGSCNIKATVNNKTYLCKVKVKENSNPVVTMEDVTKAMLGKDDTIVAEGAQFVSGPPVYTCEEELTEEEELSLGIGSFVARIVVDAVWTNNTSTWIQLSFDHEKVEKLVNGKWVDVTPHIYPWGRATSSLYPGGIVPLEYDIWLEPKDKKNFSGGIYRMTLEFSDVPHRPGEEIVVKYIVFTL